MPWHTEVTVEVTVILACWVLLSTTWATVATVTVWVVAAVTCAEALVSFLSELATGSAERMVAATTTSPRTLLACVVERAALELLSSLTLRSRPPWTHPPVSAWDLPPWVVLLALDRMDPQVLLVDIPRSNMALLPAPMPFPLVWVALALTLPWVPATCPTEECTLLPSTAALLRPLSLLPTRTPTRVLPTVAMDATTPSLSCRPVSGRSR
jgi:phosphatidylglycerophosphate synthase